MLKIPPVNIQLVRQAGILLDGSLRDNPNAKPHKTGPFLYITPSSLNLWLFHNKIIIFQLDHSLTIYMFNITYNDLIDISVF